MMNKAWMVLAAGAGAVAYRVLCEKRAQGEKQALKADVKKWEDEGGQVPQVPQVSPVVTPEKSVPDAH
jgi:hypothetical protein